MYATLLTFHSLFRWFVLIILIMAIARGYHGWLGNKNYYRSDNILRLATAGAAHLQLLIGLVLYLHSPVAQYFLNNFKTAIHQREFRFFGMEHCTMMIVAVVIITIGSVKVKRRQTGRDKFKAMAIWYTISLLLIISSIPWQFSPLVHRPYFRSF